MSSKDTNKGSKTDLETVKMPPAKKAKTATAANSPQPSNPVHAEISMALSELPRGDLEASLQALLNRNPEGALNVLEESYKIYSQDPYLLRRKDIWVENILPFLGPGHFLFVALVSKQFKEFYQAFFDSLVVLPKVVEPEDLGDFDGDPATNTSTFFRAAFASVASANFWKEDVVKHSQWQALKDKDDGFVCFSVVRHGKLEVLKWAQKEGFKWDEHTCASAAEVGKLEMLKYLHENNCEMTKFTSTHAAKSGHLDCLRYAKDNGCPLSETTCEMAASAGHLEILKYLRAQNCPWDSDTCKWAARDGHFDCLQYAHENKCPWNKRTCTAAAEGGHLNCLKYAHNNGCPWDEKTCEAAASNGHLECLKYAHANGCDWDGETCTWAANGGHLECLKYAHANGCDWNERACAEASMNGHLEVLQYIHNEDGPWNPNTVRKSARGHNPYCNYYVGEKQRHVLDWLDELNLEEFEESDASSDSESGSGDFN